MSLVTNTNDIFMKGVIGNVRKAQEDSHDMKLKTPNGDVFVVCDGMGGHVGGAKASSLAVESIVNFLNKEKYADPFVALNGALQFANMQILGFAASHPEYKGMGTTACVLLLQSDGAYFAHVGDSRIYLYLGKKKQLHRITKDHSYVQALVDAGQINDWQAEHHANKNRILKALGVTPNLQPSFGEAIPKNGDIFLICSDGLSGMIPDSTIEKVLGQNSTLEAKGELLINMAMQGETVQPGGQDNCTLELIQIDNSPWQKSEFTSYNPSKSGKKGTKKSHSIIVAIVTALIVALAVGGIYGYNKYKTIDDNKEEKIRELQSEINVIGKKINELNSKNQTNEQTIKENEKIINDINPNQESKKKNLTSRNSYIQNEIGLNNQQIDSLNKVVENLKSKKDSLEKKAKNK